MKPVRSKEHSIDRAERQMNAAAGKPGDDKLRTPNPDCPACQQKTWHTEEQWKAFHPKRGTGKNFALTKVKS